MATAKKANTATVETKKAAPRSKPAAAAAKKPATAAAPKARKTTPKAKPAAEVMPEEIERLAYRLWEERGRPEGSSTEDWARAQEILLETR